jgi:hypothetical protein
LSCPHLNYNFEPDEYVHVRTDPEGTEYVLLIHAINAASADMDNTSYHFLVTKYSYFHQTSLIQAQSSPGSLPVGEKELVLHFNEYNKMGTPADAEVFQLSDVGHVKNLTSVDGIFKDYVDHVGVHPPGKNWSPLVPSLIPESDFSVGLDDRGLFCRFAINTGVGDLDFCITPVASSLLSREHRTPPRRFTYPLKPQLFDLTPDVLGPSEGFIQAGCVSPVGFGFEPEHHATWRVRLLGSAACGLS